jgi:hypothetical protein
LINEACHDDVRRKLPARMLLGKVLPHVVFPMYCYKVTTSTVLVAMQVM